MDNIVEYGQAKDKLRKLQGLANKSILWALCLSEDAHLLYLEQSVCHHTVVCKCLGKLCPPPAISAQENGPDPH